MYLKYFSYKAGEWLLNPIPFNKQTLVVGENATGKTKMQMALFRAINTMLMKPVEPSTEPNFLAAFIFDVSSEKKLYYTVSVIENKIVHERLFYKGEDDLASRLDKKCSFYGEQNISLPEKMSVLQAKTDLVKYPEAASIIEWANASRKISFSKLHPINGYETLTIEKMYNSLETEEIAQIKGMLNELGYHIQDIKLFNLEDRIQFVYLEEMGVEKKILAMEMSNGLYRVLYILFYMFYVSKQNVKFITIDDLGEGLDYRRSTQLGRLLFEFCKEQDIQLIASSNDCFLMDSVELNNWLILSRKETQIEGISNASYPQLFERFKKMGLRNFDIFRTDFIERHKKNNNEKSNICGRVE